MKNILIIDNYDSFTYNLVQLVRKTTGREPVVKRNDKITLEAVAGFDKILLSPGPGLPEAAGIMLPLIRKYAATKRILGICLGHQAIGIAFGARLYNMDKVYHGVMTPVQLTIPEHPLFTGVPQTLPAGRYHSWSLSREHFPDSLQILAVDEAGTIMAIRHKKYDLMGLQFHPESVLTPHGARIIANWILL